MLALICSVDLEAQPVEAAIQHARPRAVGRRRAVEGSLSGAPVLLVVGGMGKTNAAQALTALLEAEAVGGVVGFGVGGAYHTSGLRTGEIALATREIYGDEGVAAPQAWLSTRDIGIPLLQPPDGPVFNELDLDPDLVARAAERLAQAGLAPIAGPFVTVSTCSGTLARGGELEARFGAVCESMEGAAYAHVSALYQIPFLEVRGISNLVEDRDLSRWKLREAAAIAAQAVQGLAELRF
ncbi:MAG: futalosine hydrolase [Gemmatimonadetes bacterium]|nr:futalosine hydrolase [Gemmatimonadota bacterium]